MSVNAVGYIRVSSVGQLKGHGPVRQREIIGAFAKSNAIEIQRFYQDAYTGTEADRPAFIDMLRDMMANGVRMVLIESLDRLARDLMVQNQLLAKLVTEGVDLIAANTGENVTEAIQSDPMRKAMVQMQGVFSELDKSQVVLKLRMKRSAIRASGEKCEGRKAYGEHANEKSVVRQILRLRRKPRGGNRLSYAAIADRLNVTDIPTRAGGQWNPSTVQNVVKRYGGSALR